MIRYFITAGALVTLALALSTGRLIDAAAETGAAEMQVVAVQDQKPFDQAQALADLRAKIASQRGKPAGEVFKNVQIFKAIPAGQLLAIMEKGYSKSLGVDCTHCHVPDQWEKEDKPTKQVARDMYAMASVINNEQLKKIKNLKSESPIVNCTTCHRGQVKPALDLP